MLENFLSLPKGISGIECYRYNDLGQFSKWTEVLNGSFKLRQIAIRSGGNVRISTSRCCSK